MTTHQEPHSDPSTRGMKPREFAKRYGLSENSVYQGCRDGSIPSIRVGNRFVILWEQWEKKAIA
jgi:predicted DNA-binding transcriptional regulator AlpA